MDNPVTLHSCTKKSIWWGMSKITKLYNFQFNWGLGEKIEALKKDVVASKKRHKLKKCWYFSSVASSAKKK